MKTNKTECKRLIKKIKLELNKLEECLEEYYALREELVK